MTTTPETFELLKKLLLGFLDVDDDFITPETTIESLNMESLDFVELQVEIQKAYGVKIKAAGFENGDVATIGDFVNHVDELRMALDVVG